MPVTGHSFASLATAVGLLILRRSQVRGLTRGLQLTLPVHGPNRVVWRSAFAASFEPAPQLPPQSLRYPV